MLLHLNARDGDVLLITEPALLTRYAQQSQAIYPAALININNIIIVRKC